MGRLRDTPSTSSRLPSSPSTTICLPSKMSSSESGQSFHSAGEKGNSSIRLNLPRSQITQTMVESLLVAYKTDDHKPKASSQMGQFLAMDPVIVRAPDFKQPDHQFDSAKFNNYNLGLLAHCSDKALRLAEPCTKSTALTVQQKDDSRSRRQRTREYSEQRTLTVGASA